MKIINVVLCHESLTYKIIDAHCIQIEDEKLRPHEVVVRLKANNLSDKEDTEVIQANVAEIHVHDGWNLGNRTCLTDLAIVVLSDNIVFTNNFIQPVRLSPHDIDLIGSKFLNIVLER